MWLCLWLTKRHAAFQYKRPLKRQQQLFPAPWKTGDLFHIMCDLSVCVSVCVGMCVCIPDYLACVIICTRICTCYSLEGSFLLPHIPTDMTAHRALLKGHTHLSRSQPYLWLTALWPKKRDLCIHYQLYRTPTLWLRHRSGSEISGEKRWKDDTVVNRAHMLRFSRSKGKEKVNLKNTRRFLKKEITVLFNGKSKQ